MSTTRRLVAVPAALFVASLALQICLADGGMLPLADVSVFGSGQKAIVAWNLSKIGTPVAHDLVASSLFWLIAGVVLGVVLGLILGHVSVGALKVGVGRLVATLDLIGCLILILLSSVLEYSWAVYAFWALVVLAVASLFLAIRTAGRGRLVLFMAIPFAAILFVYSLVLAETLEMALASVLLVGLVGAAAFPPRHERKLSEPLRESSRWFVPSRERKPL